MAFEKEKLEHQKKSYMKRKDSMKEAIRDVNGMISLNINHGSYLELANAQNTLLKIENVQKTNLSSTLKILLTTNGSVTRVLQTIQKSPGKKVEIKTMNQVIMGLGDEVIPGAIFESLEIPENSTINFRKVVLHAGRKNYALAISLTPLCRLSNEFQDDLMRADVPIGLLLEKYDIEMLRKISIIDTCVTGSGLQKLFKIPENTRIP
ncbi:MAG: chorismate--pyruvate lyase family protein, partial [Candidatus Hodarchaeota archaeon]